MATAITRFLITLLLIFILPLALVSCKQKTPQQKMQDALKDFIEAQVAKEKEQAKLPVVVEWKNMRARRVLEGTKVRWRLYVWDPPTRRRNEFAGWLEGNSSYDVVCTTLGHNMSDDDFRQYLSIVNGDWVEVVGPYKGLTSYAARGCVLIGIDELTNLGPGR